MNIEYIDYLIDTSSNALSLSKDLKVFARDAEKNGNRLPQIEQGINDALGYRIQEAKEEGNGHEEDMCREALFLFNERKVVLRALNNYRTSNDEEWGELTQAAREGLWEACIEWVPGKGSFFNFAVGPIMVDRVREVMLQKYDTTIHGWRHRPAILKAAEELRRQGLRVDAAAIKAALPEDVRVSEELINRWVFGGSNASIESQEELGIEQADPNVNIEEEVLSAEFTKVLIDHISRLGDIHKDVIEHTVIHQLTIKSFAEENNITIVQASQLRKQALSTLKEALLNDPRFDTMEVTQ